MRFPIGSERTRGQAAQAVAAVHFAFSRLPRSEGAAERSTCHLPSSRLASRTLISSVARPPISIGRQEAASVVPASLPATETQLSECPTSFGPSAYLPEEPCWTIWVA